MGSPATGNTVPKWNDEVRVLEIGSSKELCGGTHVRRTGYIGLFRIVSESGVPAGVHRVETVTGEGVLDTRKTRFGAGLRCRMREG